MSALSYKMLLRKRGTASSILAVALLVAIITSMNALVNHINAQGEVLSELVNLGGTFLILNVDSSSITHSEIDSELTDLLSNRTDVQYVSPQRIITTTLVADSANNLSFTVRGVDDVNKFLTNRKAYVNGSTPKSGSEANIGEILSRSTSIKIGDEVNLTLGSNYLKVKVVGMIRTLTQSDTELIVPMGMVSNLTGNDGIMSAVEFTLKNDVDEEEAISHITTLLPSNVKIIKVQQLREFMQEMNSQTLNFLDLWSLTVYVVVAAASYVVASRLIVESSYELTTLRALGAKKRLLFTLVITYTVTVSLLGSILGQSLGIVGTQTASTFLKWTPLSVDVAPFLNVEQALQTLLLTFAFSLLGCVYPAFSSTQGQYMEEPL